MTVSPSGCRSHAAAVSQLLSSEDSTTSSLITALRRLVAFGRWWGNDELENPPRLALPRAAMNLMRPDCCLLSVIDLALAVRGGQNCQSEGCQKVRVHYWRLSLPYDSWSGPILCGQVCFRGQMLPRGGRRCAALTVIQSRRPAYDEVTRKAVTVLTRLLPTERALSLTLCFLEALPDNKPVLVSSLLGGIRIAS